MIYHLVMRDVEHYDFTDGDLLSPLFKLLKITGRLKTKRSREVINNNILAFLDQVLKGRPARLLSELTKTYPEIKYERYPREVKLPDESK